MDDERLLQLAQDYLVDSVDLITGTFKLKEQSIAAALQSLAASNLVLARAAAQLAEYKRRAVDRKRLAV